MNSLKSRSRAKRYRIDPPRRYRSLRVEVLEDLVMLSWAGVGVGYMPVEGESGFVTFSRFNDDGEHLDTVTMTYSMTGGTASPNDHNLDTEETGVVVFGAEELDKYVPYTAIQDPRREPDEYIRFTILSVVSSAQVEYDTTGAGSYDAYIIDDDQLTPIITVTASDANAAEAGPDNGQFTITADYELMSDLMVSYTLGGTAGSGDYQSLTGTVQIDIYTSSTTIDVTPIDDAVFEGVETVTLTIVPHESAYDAGEPPATATLDIADDEQAPDFVLDSRLSVSDATVTEGGTLAFEITLTPASPHTVTVQYATDNGSAFAPIDYAHTMGTATFTPGQTSVLVSVPTVDDSEDEFTELMYLVLFDPAYAWIFDGEGLGEIEDNDVPPPPPALLSVNDASTVEGGSLNFTITLSPASSQSVTVVYATADGTARAPGDYTDTSGVATFEPGQTSFEVQVPTIDDALVEGAEFMTLFLSAPVGAQIGDGEGTGTITDNDVPPPLPPEIIIAGFYSNGRDLFIDYLIQGEVSAFNVAVYTSPDGVLLEDKLEEVPAELGAGMHSVRIVPTFTDIPKDYKLVAKVDSGDAVAETDETNNQLRFAGGAFLVHEGGSGKWVVHVHGGLKSDVAKAFQPNATHVRVTLGQSLGAAGESPPPYYDYTGDGLLSRVDALGVAYTMSHAGTPPWHNSSNPLDVNNDGHVAPIDALLVINYLSLWTERVLADTPYPNRFLDVNGDNVLSVLDAQLVIDALNQEVSPAPAWRNSANPLDIDSSGSVTSADQAALNAALPAGYGQTYDYLLTEVDEVHFRTHELHDEALLRVVSKLVPGWMFGGDGNDYLEAFTADDLLYGGAGDDDLFGNAGDDELHGEDGDDDLWGGPGDDLFNGGSGNNTYHDDPSDQPAPYAADDSYLVPFDPITDSSHLEVSATGLLANDTDPTSAGLQIASVTPPLQGSLNWSPDGSFTYTAYETFFGFDTFTYTATNGTRASAPATVFITLANRPPKFAEESFEFNMPEDVALLEVEDNFAQVVATDPDQDAITFREVGNGDSEFLFKVLSDGRIQADTGKFPEFAPTQRSYAIQVEADDGKGGKRTVDVTINLVPVAYVSGDWFGSETPADLITLTFGRITYDTTQPFTVAYVRSNKDHFGDDYPAVLARDDFMDHSAIYPDEGMPDPAFFQTTIPAGQYKKTITITPTANADGANSLERLGVEIKVPTPTDLAGGVSKYLRTLKAGETLPDGIKVYQRADLTIVDGIKLFIQGQGDADLAAMNDVRQGRINNCWFAAAAAAMARVQPAQLREMFRLDEANGKVFVKFYAAVGGQRDEVEVDFGIAGTTATAQFGDVDAAGDHEIWMKVLEKAYFASERVVSTASAWIAFTGTAATETEITAENRAAVVASISAALAANKKVTVATRGGAVIGEKTLVASHVYVVTGQVGGEADGTLTLYNPWGPEYDAQTPAIPLATLHEYVRTVDIQ